MGKLSRKLSRTRALVSSKDHAGLPIAAIAIFSASWMVVQLSTSVLSQSNRIARGGTRTSDAAGASLTALTPRTLHAREKALLRSRALRHRKRRRRIGSHDLRYELLQSDAADTGLRRRQHATYAPP